MESYSSSLFGHKFYSLSSPFCSAAGIVLEEKNWPPFCPIIHHDIANEVPIHLQKLQYTAFSTFLGMSAFAQFYGYCVYNIVNYVIQLLLTSQFYVLCCIYIREMIKFIRSTIFIWWMDESTIGFLWNPYKSTNSMVDSLDLQKEMVKRLLYNMPLYVMINGCINHLCWKSWVGSTCWIGRKGRRGEGRG